ncbi:hypothetical protein TWF106_003522 [Orbilia oligospora]|uniref:Uncharacterized protein n=1 Tax=Orbilia oligospora TaxID=2813651 RepID=A0A6G1M4R8_ORBOL|nr:hypothetical protein TWF788_010895 [Orbilia oligospora]KAF3199943.1 hypothetical protein TWF106_003522 [Orbilia oligospora]KAF3202876.1 hypothetical protein TWF191_002853 [Orbilia oligospora]KAF3217742.1 hypothetical protein TWF679_001943 [Orbilia oligospora]KAF3242979.1 hypothetical protein TWF192_008447 [Orbilia oligospora]
MANKNNINRPSASKPKARPKTKPSHALRRISKTNSTANHQLSSKKSRKLLRNKAYTATRIIEEVGKEGGDVLMRDETLSRKKEKLLKNLAANQEVKEQKEAVMDVDVDEAVAEDL